MTPVEMSHHATAKVHIPSTIESAKYVYVRTDAVRAPLVRPYTGPFKVLEKSAKHFKILKNGRPDNVSVDRLKPAFIYNNIDKEREDESRNSEPEVTKPRVSSDPETEVPATTSEVAEKSYRDALIGDQWSHGRRLKRTYTRKPPKQRTETASTRSGRVSKPPVRF